MLAELVALTSALDAAGVDYAICGALALAVHGAPRATRDIDLLALPADLLRVRDIARACGFTIEALPMKFAASGITIRRFTKTAPGNAVMLDVLIADDPLADVWATRMRIAYTTPDGDRPLSVTSLLARTYRPGKFQDAP